MRFVSGVVLFAGLLGCSTEHRPVDLILRGGAVYTMNPAQPRAEALAIADGRIVAVGSDEEISAVYASENTIDLEGQMVLPGFVDSHSHAVASGVALAQCDLALLDSVADVLAKVTACGDAQPGTGWLVGGGWNPALFKDANPNKALLDSLGLDRPVALESEDSHSLWVDSRALALAGITRDSTDPSGGVIERDLQTAEASGTLRERTAMNLVQDQVPPISDAVREAGLLRALALAKEFGITSIIEASAGASELAAYDAVDARGELSVRVVVSVQVTDPQATELMRPQDRGTARRVHADAAKIFVDGVLESETAALLEPYLDNPGSTGQLLELTQQLNARVVDLDRRGIQVHLHAIGDRAVRAALDAVAAARIANGALDNRHHIAHLQLVDPADRSRFAELGVVANIQALWAYPDAYITDLNLLQVGQARVDQMYPFASLVRAGTTLAGGSDWSVSSMNPLLAIQTGIMREDPAGVAVGVLNSAERLPLQKMLEAYTTNGAYLMHQENHTGSLEVGKFADIVVLDRDLFDVPVAQISEVHVTRTLLAGGTVYSR